MSDEPRPSGMPGASTMESATVSDCQTFSAGLNAPCSQGGQNKDRRLRSWFSANPSLTRSCVSHQGCLYTCLAPRLRDWQGKPVLAA